MRYRNTKTGFEFDSISECKGENLELVEGKEAEKKPVAKKRKAADKTCTNHSPQ